MASRARGGRGRGGSGIRVERGPSGRERQPKPIRSIEELTDKLYSLNQRNIETYGDTFAGMVLDYSTDDGKIKDIVDVIFDTTVQSKEYASLGAKVCERIIVPSNEKESECVSARRSQFRSILLKRFQSEYKQKEQVRASSIESWLAIFSFLCEVFQSVRVGQEPIQVVGKAILSTMSWMVQLQDCDDDEIECVCMYLKSAGQLLDTINHDGMKNLVKYLRPLVITRKSTARRRCLILEVLEYRAMGWTDREDELNVFFMDAVADAVVEDEIEHD